MNITFLSGGTGTPKLIAGARRHLADRDLAVVVNTAEDMWVSGGHLSPDIDTVMYLFAGLLNTATWWGIRGDTFVTHEYLDRFGEAEVIALGDRDRAVNLARAAMLRRGLSLTEATARLCERMGIEAAVLPMTDTEVTSCIDTAEGLLHFQEYWVRRRGQVAIRGVVRRYDEPPVATSSVIGAIEECDAVVIGPSNPVTSIGPILECESVREALRARFVVAVSPFIGDAPVSGPAAALMEACGHPPTAAGTFALYEDFVDLFVQDTRDTRPIEGAAVLDTLMVDEDIAAVLAGAILDRIQNAAP
ncbi:MAG TPA: 2-phospho-L-lactate transferase [Methanoculleus sp.]|nr:2-phospho-L-lactate transferase [Methanoculleus sp.]